MDKNTQIFLDFWKSYQWPKDIATVYKLYYDDLGKPLFYTTQDLPGNYIEITVADFFAASMNVIVKNNCLEKIEKNQIRKLKPSSIAGTQCHPADVSIVVSKDSDYKLWCVDND